MDRNQVLRLIELYREHTLLWDPKYRDSRYKEHKDEAWAAIGRQMNMHPVDCQRKIENLKSSLRRETMKIRKSRIKEGSDEIYESRWFGFEPLQFLLKKNPYEIDKRDEDEDVAPSSTAALPAHPTAFEVHAISDGGRATPTPLPRCYPSNRVKFEDESLNESSNQIPHSTVTRVDDHNYHFANLVASKLSHFSEEVQYALQADIMNLFLRAKQGYYDTKCI